LMANSGYLRAYSSTLTKLNSSGKIQWQRDYPGGGGGKNSILFRDNQLSWLVSSAKTPRWELLRIDSDGNLIRKNSVTSEHYIADSGILADGTYVAMTPYGGLFACDSQGNPSWQVSANPPSDVYFSNSEPTQGMAKLRVDESKSGFCTWIVLPTSPNCMIRKYDQFGTRVWESRAPYTDLLLSPEGDCGQFDAGTLYIYSTRNSEEAPKILRPINGMLVTPTLSNFVVSPQVSGQAPLYFQWFSGTNLMSNETSSALRPSRYGPYSFSVSNAMGDFQSSTFYVWPSMPAIRNDPQFGVLTVSDWSYPSVRSELWASDDMITWTLLMNEFTSSYLLENNLYLRPRRFYRWLPKR
jgi:hypothetical protein